MDIGKKIIVTFISEVVEALLIIIFIIILSALGETNELVKPISQQLIGSLVLFWISIGVLTPIIIFLDLLEPIANGFKGILGNLGNIKLK